MKMKKTALRALYGALTLSLIILGGCDQPTSSNNNNNKDTDEDLWYTLLDANGNDKNWVKYIDGEPQNIKIKFTPDRKIYIKTSTDDSIETIPTYIQCTFDGRVIKSDDEDERNHKIIITNFKTITGNLKQFDLDASGSRYIDNLDSEFGGNFHG
jgi:hypothetical protein